MDLCEYSFDSSQDEILILSALSLEASKGLCDVCSAKEQITASLELKSSNTILHVGSDSESCRSEIEADASDSGSEHSTAALLAETMASITKDLLSVLGHDMALLARLLPQIHTSLQAQLCYENNSYAGSDYNNGADSIGDYGNLASWTTRKSSTTSSLGKRSRDGREEDDERDDGENEHPKKPSRPQSNDNNGVRYACPFHKRWPDIYTNAVGTKYRSCSGPGQVEVRRLK